MVRKIKLAAAALAGAALTAIALWIAVPPAQVSGIVNDQVDGMVFWGTSAMSRLYGDVYAEEYTVGGADRDGNTRDGEAEIDQHEWASYHRSDGKDYGYLNLGKFTNYVVDDAQEYAVLGDWYSGWSSDSHNNRWVSIAQSSFIADTKPQYWQFGTGGDGHVQTPPASVTVSRQNPGGGAVPVMDAIEAARARTRAELDYSSTKDDPPTGNTRYWEYDKIAVTIWAGEDWVVRNKESSDEGIVGNVKVIDDAGPTWTTQSSEKLLQVDWMGLDVEDDANHTGKFCHYFDPATWATSWDPVGDIMYAYRDDSGTAEVARTIEINKPVGSHYGKEEEQVIKCGDPVFPNKTNSNRLNDLEHKYGDDTSSADPDFHHMYVYWNSYIVTNYHMSQWEDRGDGTMVHESGFSYNMDQDGIDLVLEHELDEETDKFPDGSQGTTKASLPSEAGQCFGRVISGYDYKVEYLVQDVTKKSTINDRILTTYYYHPTHHVDAFGYHWYTWERVDNVQYHLRCDEDLAPDDGYADSWHWHGYGRMDGFNGGNARDGFTYQNVVDHPDDDGYDDYPYVYVKCWYTNPDKPIMKPVVETRHVSGYAEYWRHQTDPGLMVYVFGLGPYNKAIYEDQKDEIWTDGEEPARNTNGDFYLNGDEKIDQYDRVRTNNSGTANMRDNGDWGPGIGKGISSLTDHLDDWLVSSTSTDEHGNRWDLSTGGFGGTVGQDKTFIDEIARTDRIDAARKAFNSALQSNLRNVRFVDIYDLTLEHVPYYRYQNLVSAGVEGGGASGMRDAVHGKWYDKNVNNWVFHMMWATILNDNPNPAQPEAIDISLYAASCALTSYANQVVSTTGRADGTDAVHTLTDLQQAGMAGAGGALGYGDDEYGFIPGVTTRLSETSSFVDYASLAGIENADGAPGDSSEMYLYARYGRLLQDLGIDKTGTSASISTRAIPGAFLSLMYVGNSALSVVWDVSFELLKMLNPFQFFAEASNISAIAKSDMYDASHSILVRLAHDNPGVAAILSTVGTIYDTLTWTRTTTAQVIQDPFTGQPIVVNAGQDFSVTMLYIVFFVASVLLFYNTWSKQRGKIASKTFQLLFRLTFIFIGVPMLGVMYTSVLNGLDGAIQVTAAPSSQMVSSTFVDFAGWVKNARLAPLTDTATGISTTLESDGQGISGAGAASDRAIGSLRKTAWAVNSRTGIVPDVDMTVFTSNGSLDDFSEWNTVVLQEYSNVRPDDWRTGIKSATEVQAMITDWMKGEFYYASDFESETMARFSTSSYSDRVGRHKGVDEDVTVTNWDNDNTLYQMFESTSTADAWLGREISDNGSIFSGTGEYAIGSSEGTDWSPFNIYANGAMTATPSTSVSADTLVTYSKGTEHIEDATLSGLGMQNKVGLSTLAMYNYLNTDFGPSGMSVYSSALVPNGHTAMAHYKVNMVGSGAMEIVFFANCFAFLLAVVVIGFVYALGMCVSVIKKGLSMLMSVPGALLGVMGSIVQVIGVVVTMIIEILGSILAYQILSEVLMAFMTALEGPLMDALSNTSRTTATAAVGGLMAMPFGVSPDALCASAASYLLYLGGTALLVTAGSAVAVRMAPAFLRVHAKAYEAIMLRFVLCSEVADAYLAPRPEDKRGISRVPAPAHAMGVLEAAFAELFAPAESAKLTDCQM